MVCCVSWANPIRFVLWAGCIWVSGSGWVCEDVSEDVSEDGSADAVEEMLVAVMVVVAATRKCFPDEEMSSLMASGEYASRR